MSVDDVFGWIAFVVAVLFVLAALGLGAAAVVQLARLQAAVMKHRASEGTWADDDALYRSSGFETRDINVMRGDQIR